MRQAVIAWVEREGENGAPQASLSLAATLIGSGGTGIAPAQAAQLVAQGVYQANDLIRKSSDRRRLPEVRELRLIELYLNRATEAWEALKMLAHASPTRYRITEPIVAGVGSLEQPLRDRDLFVQQRP